MFYLFYPGNFLPGAGNELEGKDEARYGKWGGICLMTQGHTILLLIFVILQ